MKSLGTIKTKEELEKLIHTHGLEFVEVRTSKVPDHLEATFVHYNPGTKDGKFHHYVSVEIPHSVFKEWTPEVFK